tara:strand:- start:405 stop:653 length:249 start_codon:yes stop_codon:yes gene_type:complete
MKTELRLLLILTIIYVGTKTFFNLITPTDPTDAGRFERSGMHFYTDYGTGCHYLAGGGFFGKQILIPRMGKDGKQVCENIKE